MSADTEWEALDAALVSYTPPCTGRSLFTADRQTATERELCESICARCRVKDLCDAYATADRDVNAGFWGGRFYTQKRNR